MITLRSGSHAHRLLLVLAVTGEYPMRSLHLLGSSRTLEDTVRRLENVQRFAYPLGQTLAPVKCSPQAEGATGGPSVCIRVRFHSCRPSTRQPLHTI